MEGVDANLPIIDRIILRQLNDVDKMPVALRGVGSTSTLHIGLLSGPQRLSTILRHVVYRLLYMRLDYSTYKVFRLPARIPVSGSAHVHSVTMFILAARY